MTRRFLGVTLVALVGCGPGPMGDEHDSGALDDEPVQDSGSATDALTVNIDRSTTTETFRDLLGTNKDPEFLRRRDEGTPFSAAAVYRFLGITQVRLHDGDLDLCDIYQPATLYDMENGGAVLTECRGSGDPSDHHRWDVDDPADVDLPGSYDFAAADRSVLAVAEAGAKVYLRLGESFQGPNDTATPESWSRVAANIARHYQGDFGAPVGNVELAAIEIHNEPGGSFWVGPSSGFYDLFERTYARVSVNHPTLPSGGPGFRHQAIDELSDAATLAGGFLPTVNSTTADFISGHYYAGCEDSSPQQSLAWLETLRAEVDASQHAGKPLHISEWNIGLECSGQVFGGTRAQAFAATLLGLMQDPSLDIRAAHQYAGVGVLISLVSVDVEGTSTDMSLNPIAWALWAHSKLLGGDKVATNLCEGGECLSVHASVQGGGVLTAVSALRDGAVYAVVVNDGAGPQTIHVRDPEGSRAVWMQAPAASSYTLATAETNGTYAPTTEAMNALEASIVEEELASVGEGTWELALDPYSVALVRID